MVDRPFTPRTLASVPLVGQPRARPVGPGVVGVVEHDARSQLVLWPQDGSAARPLTADVAPSSARVWGSPNIDWSPDGRYVAFVAGSTEGQDVWTIEVDTGTLRRVTAYNWPDRTPRWSPDGQHLALVTEVDGRDTISVVVAAGNWPQRLTDPAFDSAEPAWSPDGRLLAFVSNRAQDQRGHNRDVWLVDRTSGEERRLTDPDGNADSEPCWSPDGGTIAFVSERSGWKQIWTMSPDGRHQRVLLAEEAEQTEPAWSLDGRYLAFTRRSGVTASVAVLDVGSGEGIPFRPAGPEGSTGSPSWAADGETLYAVRSSPVEPDDIWSLSLSGTDPERITHVMPVTLRSLPLVQPTTIHYRSTDGLEVEALLFAPPDARTGERRPGLVYIHGGPTWQVERAWNPEVQHLVACGYAVIAPNFRGSTGYGRAFDRANDGDWGGGDLDDCVAAASELRRLPWIAPDRVGIWGGSYGGYMTLLALGKRPEAFQAGVGLYGSSDEATLWMQTDAPGRRGIEQEIGVPLLDRAPFRAGAPLRYAHQISAPLLMLHGEEDRRVTLAQSEAMRAALDRLGKVFEYHRYPGEPHGFRKIENWVDVQEKIEDFLGRYL